MFKLSTKIRYATRIMVYLGKNEGQGKIRKQEIADAEGISHDYTEQILMKLKSGGLVHSYRGAKGNQAEL